MRDQCLNTQKHRHRYDVKWKDTIQFNSIQYDDDDDATRDEEIQVAG